MSTDQIPVENGDPNIGRELIRHDDMPGTIASRAGDHYVVRWQDGKETPIKVCTYQAADRAHLAELCQRSSVPRPRPQVRPAAQPTDDVMRTVDAGLKARTAMPDLRAHARQVLAEMDLVRAGVKPTPLTTEERNRILANIRSAPPSKLTRAEQDKILARLRAK